MKADYIGVRVSAELKQLVEGYGPASTAAQALIVLGAAQLGADPATVLADITALAGRRQLRPEARAALAELINKKINKVLIIQPLPEPDTLELGDPLLSVGIEV